jgi:hypothetical protein
MEEGDRFLLRPLLQPLGSKVKSSYSYSLIRDRQMDLYQSN